MHKTIILSLCLFLVCTFLKAQNPVEINYITHKVDRDELLTGLIDILDVRYLILQIKGDLPEKQFSLVEHVVKDKQLTSTPIPMNFSTKDSIMTGTIMAFRQPNDSVKINIYFKGHFNFTRIYPIKNSHAHILMETFLDHAPKDNLPIFGYTRGIAEEMEYNGEKGTWIDYCGLRDAKIFPEKWGEKYDITDYVYFTLTVK